MRMRSASSSLHYPLTMLPRTVRLLAFLLALSFPRALGAAPQETGASIVSRFAALEAAAASFVEEQGVVGLSLAFLRDGAVAHQAHFGFEDREAAVPASAATRYRWASISKPLTAVAALQLWEREQLDLECDVRTLVPEFPDKQAVITVRQLLCHQGGIVHYSNGKVIATPPPSGVEHPYADVVVALRRFQDSPLVCEPGSAYAYTTHGYMLLGAAVERAGKEAFALQVKRRVCEPLGLTTLRPDYAWEAIEHRAVGYKRVADQRVRSTDTDVSWKLAGGGWISTVGDLAGFGAGLLGDKLVRAETKARMWTPQKTRDGKATAYGLGFQLRSAGGRRYVEHSGSQEKTATFLLLMPDERAGVAVMCNTEGTSLAKLARDLAQQLLEQQ